MACDSSYIKIASSSHSATVILMHGLGDSGRSMYATASWLRQDPALQHIQWILPQAPIRPVAANGNRRMSAWFNVCNVQFQGKEDEEGMFDSARTIEQLIDEELSSGIDPSRIVLAGFMQGAALSLLAGLTTPKKLAGLAVLSGRLPIPHKMKGMASAHAPSLPIFWGYNIADPLAGFAFDQLSVKFLTQEMGFPTAVAATGDVRGIELHGYRGLGTGISSDELRDLGVWLKKALPRFQ
ncbi:Phospholipase/carboxylesterase/thioesterase [Favolaschia claudopus]|uniref:Acyl-protein thioesterase 1 n=1 Tax=Favolaschia claudopus TaxID=2862362 RepID=A0AAW0EJL8_9AGAR